MTTHIQDNLTEDTLSYEELLAIAMNSGSTSIQEAFKKLEFLIRLSHNAEEIEAFRRFVPVYKVRIGLPKEMGKAGQTYEYVTMDIQGTIVDVTYNRNAVCGRLKAHKENIFYL
jgi:hypothetical protein